MKNKKQNYVVVMIFIVLVLIGLAIVGYFGLNVFNNPSQKQQESSQNTEPQLLNDIETAEAEYLGQTHTSSLGAFSMTVLNGWELVKDETYDYIFSYNVDDIRYDASKDPIISSTNASGVGGFVPGIAVSVNPYNQEIVAGDVFVLNDGTEGLCEVSVYSEKEVEDMMGASGQGGFVSKNCLFKKGDIRLMAGYSYYEQTPLDTESVEWALKTIKILN